ncbi:hypothetical protein [Fluctibacter halophilus]|nr:hypothetical protein [Aestuariibacter halophilus]
MKRLLQSLTRLTQKPAATVMQCNYANNYYGDQVCTLSTNTR